MRWKAGKAYKHCDVFYTAIQKYGWENFDHEILEADIDTLEKANKQEQYWIAFYHTWVRDPNCHGYNITKGGQNKGSAGNVNWLKPIICLELGKVWDSVIEAATELGYNSNGIVMCCKEQRKSAYGYHWVYLDNYNTDKLKYNKYLQQPKVFLNGQSKKVLCIETNIVYKSAGKAAKAVNLSSSASIIGCCNGKRKRAAGLSWKYL